MNLVSDFVFDDNSKQLYSLIQDCPDEFKLSKYNHVFKGYDGSSGFDIPSKLNKEERIYFEKTIASVLKTCNH